jgi:pimeloyl-ACP methyl ester carboxylesterase
LPQAKLELLRGVGHMPHWAAPDRVAEAVAAFADGTFRAKLAP